METLSRQITNTTAATATTTGRSFEDGIFFIFFLSASLLFRLAGLLFLGGRVADGGGEGEIGCVKPRLSIPSKGGEFLAFLGLWRARG